MSSKYLGEMFDGRWEVVNTTKRRTKYYYLLKNIYNHEIMVIHPDTMTKLANKKTTVSKIRSIRLRREKLPNDSGWEFAGRRR